MTENETNTTEVVAAPATRVEQNANKTLSSKGRSKTERSDVAASNVDKQAARIVDALTIASGDTTNAIKAAVVYLSNAKDAFGKHLYTMHSIGQVFTKHDTKDVRTVVDDLLDVSDRVSALKHSLVEAERDKSHSGKAKANMVKARIKDVRELLNRAFAAVLYVRDTARAGSDVRERADGQLEFPHGKTGDAVQGSSSAFVAAGKKVATAKYGQKRVTANKPTAALTTNITALSMLIARAELMTEGKAPLASVAVEGPYWSRLYLALSENMRIEKANGTVKTRALSTLIEPATIAALREHAKQAAIGKPVAPAAKPVVTNRAVGKRKGAK